ncbi:MAG: lipoprotein LipL21 [Leptospiraceae bacterium]|nr:lipoprotein LipL21 [Leptospiraceae bacterium]
MYPKKTLVLFLTSILFMILSCAGDKEAHSLDGGQKFEGWAGPPEEVSKKPFDFFYMKKVARASEKAVNKRSGAMMQSTCVDAATTQAKGDLIGKMIGESLTGASGVSDGESTGAVVVREFNGKLKGVNVKECKPKAVATPDVPGSEYTECECVIFVKIPGGRDAIIAKAQEVEKSN